MLTVLTYFHAESDGIDIEQQLNASGAISLQYLDYFTESYCLPLWYRVRTSCLCRNTHNTSKTAQLSPDLTRPPIEDQDVGDTDQQPSFRCTCWAEQTNGYGTIKI